MTKTVTTKYTIAEATERLRHLDLKGEIASKYNFNEICYISHLVAVSRGWWHTKDGVTPLERNIGEMIALAHSELSEGLEGIRKDLPSDHIDNFSMFEEEMADTVIRIGDLSYALGAVVMLAIFAKLTFNRIREDHSLEARNSIGGKSF